MKKLFLIAILILIASKANAGIVIGSGVVSECTPTQYFSGDFETGSCTSSPQTYWTLQSSGTGTGYISTSSPIDGAKSMYLYSPSGPDTNQSRVFKQFLASSITGSHSITFKIKPDSTANNAYMHILAYNGSDTQVSFKICKLWGTNGFDCGVELATPSSGVTYTRTLDIYTNGMQYGESGSPVDGCYYPSICDPANFDPAYTNQSDCENNGETWLSCIPYYSWSDVSYLNVYIDAVSGASYYLDSISR